MNITNSNSVFSLAVLIASLLTSTSSLATENTFPINLLERIDIRGVVTRQSQSNKEIPFQTKLRIDSESWYGLFVSTLFVHELTFVDSNKFNMIQFHSQIGAKYQTASGNVGLRAGIYSGREYMYLTSGTRLETNDVGISGSIFGEYKISDTLWLHASAEPESWLKGLNADVIAGIRYQLSESFQAGALVSLEFRDLKMSDYQYGAGVSLSYRF